MSRVLTALLAMLPVLLALALPRSAAAAAERCFPETRICIAGPILTYWEQNGGLAVFGYPITWLRTETVEGTWTGPTQWFERDRLEDHTNEGKGVLAGRLGARLLQLQTDRPPLQTEQARRGCVFFPQTSFNACDQFLSYWQRNGGLARFGYPLTPVMQEAIGGTTYTVQYFERRRMEYHPEFAGTTNEVQLGLLGNDLFGTARTDLSTYRSADGAWSVQYPAFLSPEEIGSGTVIFISRDRQTFVAIDSYRDERDLRANTGEELRRRARTTLARIYGKPLQDTLDYSQLPASSRWDAGLSFISPAGATGAALYEQRKRPRVACILYAWPSSVLFLVPQIEAMEQSLVVNKP